MHAVQKSLLLTRRTALIALGIGFCLLVAAAGLTAFATREYAATELRATQAERSLDAATQVLGALSELETIVRSYQLTAANDLLPAAELGQRQLRRTLAALQRELGLAGDSADFAALRALVLEHSEVLEQRLRVAQETDIFSAVSAIDEREAQARAARLRESLHELQRTKLAAFAQMSTSAAARGETLNHFSLGLVGVAIACGAVGLWLLARRVREMDGLVKVCAWTRRVQWQGTWMSFEDFLAQRFNVRCTHGMCEEAAEQIRRENSLG